MNKKHFTKNFMEPVPVENFSNDEREMSFDSESQILKISEDGDCFEFGWYTLTHLL